MTLDKPIDPSPDQPNVERLLDNLKASVEQAKAERLVTLDKPTLSQALEWFERLCDGIDKWDGADQIDRAHILLQSEAGPDQAMHDLAAAASSWVRLLPDKCGNCDGTGAVLTELTYKCPVCDGSGETWNEELVGAVMVQFAETPLGITRAMAIRILRAIVDTLTESQEGR